MFEDPFPFPLVGYVSSVESRFLAEDLLRFHFKRVRSPAFLVSETSSRSWSSMFCFSFEWFGEMEVVNFWAYHPVVAFMHKMAVQVVVQAFIGRAAARKDVDMWRRWGVFCIMERRSGISLPVASCVFFWGAWHGGFSFRVDRFGMLFRGPEYHQTIIRIHPQHVFTLT